MRRVIVAIILMAVGAFLWWAFSPLLFDKEVNEELDPELEARLEAQRQVDENRAKSGANNEPSETDENLDSETAVDSESGIATTGPFPITGTTGHPASGKVEVIQSAEELLIRYKDYDGTNGPDLHVYLSKDLEAEEFIDLGPAKGNKGNIIYGAPLDADLTEYKYILTWCKAFGVLFDYAEIN